MNEDVNQDEDAPDPEMETSDPEIAEPIDEPGIEEDADAAPTPHDLSGELSSSPVQSKNSAFMGVPIEIIISVGKARPLVSELVNLRRDSVITLDSKIDDPVEIFIGDRLIARGELQEMENEEGQLGVRLTEVADLSNGV